MARGSSDSVRAVPVLYLAPWIDYGGSDKGTIDWFKWIDRERFAPSLITTQPSPNRRLAEVEPYAEEIWALPDLMPGEDFPRFVFDFIDSRGVEVVHIMNSRLAFELLPDFAALPRPPRIVVQLHVEEQTKDGYVRYVTTRYGNLVDTFSVTSHQLAAALEGYGVPRDKIEVIYTGVDAEEEFAPDRVEPIERFDGECVEILYPGRLTEQKDPLLMVEVATALRQRHDGFRIEVVGDGNLEEQVRALVEQRGLQQHVRFSPPSREIGRWFAACDLLLMTSVFEGVPYVVYEAMAMGLPIVAPALPGNVELMGGEGGALIDPRDDVAAYVEALLPLVRDREHRRAVGDASRRRALERFSLREMAQRHERLYERLVATLPPAEEEPEVPLPPRIRLVSRPLREQPLVSLIVPCFNDGRYLSDCLGAIAAQDYPALETIVVDDGSTDSATVALLDELGQRDDLTVLRQPENRGPSAARNAAIEIARGRYVLPVDADNILLPGAVTALVRQLQAAGEEVGFVYPNLQFFGNRDDYYQPPEYNGYTLLHGNYCDTSSLFDRELFDAGLRFDERIVLGHEDWDFILTLAEHGVIGERARTKTLRYRKQGFSRSDIVDHAQDPFHELMPKRHPALYGTRQFRPPFVTQKARWQPQTSIVPLADVAGGADVLEAIQRQSALDVELLAFSADDWPQTRRGANVRRFPREAAPEPAQRLATAVAEARGEIVVVTIGDGSDLLRRAEFVEKAIRVFAASRDLGAIAFAACAGGEHDWQPLAAERQRGAAPCVLAWHRDRVELPSVAVPDDDALGAIARALVAADAELVWFALADATPPPAAGVANDARARVSLPLPPPARPRSYYDAERSWPAAVPATRQAVRRWSLAPSWVPPLSRLLCRHRELGSEQRVITLDREPPAGHYLEHVLGAIRTVPFPGTARLLRSDDGQFRTVPAGPGAAEQQRRDELLLGNLELVPFPLLKPVRLTRHPETGQQTLITDERDPLWGAVKDLGVIGWIEPFPLAPRKIGERSDYGLIGVVRGVDQGARCHRYGVGEVPPGAPAGELGALIDAPIDGTEPVWQTARGALVTARVRAPVGMSAPTDVARWTLAPLRWNGSWSRDARARAVGRRALQGARAQLPRRSPRLLPSDAPVGHLFRDDGPRRLALYAAWHPVTRDQLLTTFPLEATDLGYEEPTLLGYLAAKAPVTGELGPRTAAIPWASRFGSEARRG